MSTIRSVVLLAKKLTAPFVPAGTIAALASTVPSSEFRVDTTGCVCPVGQVVRYPSNPCGTTVIFNEYAAAPAGTPHELEGTGKERLVPPARDGPPNVPVGFRVSNIRQGVSG